ncbi:MAG TPA: BON domain-containing protein [Gammaproteobacteria bacterium]|nr:BON domain-containing protein [Gammaproteobacteria bacterium]
MKSLRNLMMLVVLASILSGCILVIPDDGDSPHGHWSRSHASADTADRDLAQAVRTSLEGDSQTRAAAISVHSSRGDITLQGSVADAGVLGRAVALAASTPGVQKVVCEIVVLKK